MSDSLPADEHELSDDPAERVLAIVTRVVETLELGGTVSVEESDAEIRATVVGDDLDLLIGPDGATIDAVQYIAARAAFGGAGRRKAVVVDAAGYRAERQSELEAEAEAAARSAVDGGQPVELAPMTAQERRIVHTYLSERPDVETHSEGDEPARRLIVSPVRGER